MDNLSLNDTTDFLYNVNGKILATLYLRSIHQRIHEGNFNFLGMFTGKHRVGKSLAAVSMATALDPTFAENLEKRVVYFHKDFMGALKTMKKENVIGGAIVWDEAGVGLPARDWYELSNKSVNYTLQVFGRYRPIVFFVTPDVHYIDSQARKMFHGFYEMSRMSNKFASMKPFDVRYNRRTDKVLYVYSRFYLRNEGAPGNKIILRRIHIKKPQVEVESHYEDHSKDFKDRIVATMEERSRTFEKGDTQKGKMTSEEIVKTIVSEKDPRVFQTRIGNREGRIYLSKEEIRHHFKISSSLSMHIKRAAEMELNKVPESERIVDSEKE